MGSPNGVIFLQLYKLLKSGSPIRTVRHVGDKKLAQAQDELHQFYETPVDITSVHYQTPNVGDVEGSSSKYRYISNVSFPKFILAKDNDFTKKNCN